MRIDEIIEEVRQMKPNVYSDAQMVQWINETEQDIHNVLNMHKNEQSEFLPHESVGDDVLLERVYKNIYVYYLYSQIDYANAEINLYNNDVSVYTQLFEDFSKRCRREKLPEKNIKITGGI